MNDLIWVSSIQHLNAFIPLSKDRSLVKSSDQPKVRALFTWIPIIFYSKGMLKLEEDIIEYQASKPNNGILKGYKNLLNDLQFNLQYSDIVTIERYKHPEFINNYYNTNWIRIKTTNKQLDGDLLIAKSGVGPSMNQIINGTNRIYDEIQRRIIR
jgi:hypothetical protein